MEQASPVVEPQSSIYVGVQRDWEQVYIPTKEDFKKHYRSNPPTQNEIQRQTLLNRKAAIKEILTENVQGAVVVSNPKFLKAFNEGAKGGK